MKITENIYNFAASIDYSKPSLKELVVVVPFVSQIFFILKNIAFYRDVNSHQNLIKCKHLLNQGMDPKPYEDLRWAKEAYRIGTLIRMALWTILAQQTNSTTAFVCTALDGISAVVIYGLTIDEKLDPKGKYFFVPPKFIQRFV